MYDAKKISTLYGYQPNFGTKLSNGSWAPCNVWYEENRYALPLSAQFSSKVIWWVQSIMECLMRRNHAQTCLNFKDHNYQMREMKQGIGARGRQKQHILNTKIMIQNRICPMVYKSSLSKSAIDLFSIRWMINSKYNATPIKKSEMSKVDLLRFGLETWTKMRKPEQNTEFGCAFILPNPTRINRTELCVQFETQ